MAVSEDFITYLLDQLSGIGDVTARKMFGGAGLYLDGRMFGLIAGDTAYLKVDDTNRAQFVEAGAEPFKPYPDKKMVMSYYEIPPAVLDDRTLLAQWAAQSVNVSRAGAKPGRKRK